MFIINKKEDKFYTLLSQAGNNVNEAAIILRESLDSLDKKEFNVNRIEDLEHKGDELVHNIIKELNEAFITPIDREDIYAIIQEIDNILDSINSTMHRFVMFNINECTKEGKLLCDMLVKSTGAILKLMNELKLIGNRSNHIDEKLLSIDKIENEADCLFRNTVKELFSNESDPLIVIKWKEIYQIFENTIDTCKKVASIVEGVVMKNA